MPPISPDEVIKKRAASIPEQVIECFNELIAKNWDGNSSLIFQKEIIGLIYE